MGNELAIREDMPLTELGTVLAKSGFFTDARDASQAIVKVLAGREIGFGPVASMTGIYIVKGRPALSANLMAAAIKRSSKYNYRVVQLTDQVAEVAFFENGQEIGRSRFTADDARRAGTQNMDKYPRNMLFARALSNGAKWYTPDIFGGPVYTPEELGAPVNEDGEVIEGQLVEPAKQPELPAPKTNWAQAQEQVAQQATQAARGVVYVKSEVQAPAAANGKRPDDAPPTGEDWEKWFGLMEEAAGLGVDAHSFEPPDQANLGQLRAAFGALKNAMKAKQQAA